MSNTPSRNPAGNDSLAGLLKFVLRKFLQRTDTCLPATVIAFSGTSNRAQVQPAIVQITTGEEQVGRGQIASVPVLQLGGGGFVLYYPVKTNDTGWIIACDRDISLYKQNYKTSAPNSFRMHNFADSWFVPDTLLNGVNLIDSSKLCLQSYDGTLGITMGDGELDIIAPTIKLTAPNIALIGDVAITGNFHNNGTDIGSNHRHTGVQTGLSDTGPPV